MMSELIDSKKMAKKILSKETFLLIRDFPQD